MRARCAVFLEFRGDKLARLRHHDGFFGACMRRNF
jgi:hypothetical protein